MAEESLTSYIIVDGNENIGEDDLKELKKGEDGVEIKDPHKKEEPKTVEVNAEDEHEASKNLEEEEPVVKQKEQQPTEESKQKEEAEKEQAAKNPQLTIMVIGRTGVGKSTLINSLMGKKVAKAEDTIHPTKHPTIVEHTGTVCDIQVMFCDTRGLGDPELKNKDLMTKFKKKMSECPDRFVVLICQRFTDKFDDSVERFAELLGRYFKNDYTIWKNCVLVLTQANMYRPEDCDDDDDDDHDDVGKYSQEEYKLKMEIRMEEWAKKIEVILKKHNVPEAIIMNMPVCAAGNRKKIAIHVTDNWKKTLMDTCLERQQGFQSAHQMKRQSIKTAVLFSAAAGGAVGAAAIPVVGIPIGALIGAAVGRKISNDTSKKVIHNKERKEFRDRKIDELTKTKEDKNTTGSL